MKILIVSNSIIGQTLEVVVKASNQQKEVLLSSHEKALENFLLFDPTHIIVLDYDEHGIAHETDFNRGYQSYHDIQNSNFGNSKILRCGFSAYDHPDYVIMPFRLEDILEDIKIL